MRKLFLTFASALCFLAANSLYANQLSVESAMCRVNSTCTGTVKSYINQWEHFVVDAEFTVSGFIGGKTYNCIITSNKDNVSVQSIKSSRGLSVIFENPSQKANLGSEAKVDINAKRVASARNASDVTFRFHRNAVGRDARISLYCSVYGNNV